MSLDPSPPRAPHRRGRVLAALVVAAVGLTIVSGGAAEAKDKIKPKTKAAVIEEAAKIEAKADASTREYTGTVDGTNAYIALVVTGKDVKVYICDGSGLSIWLQAKVAKDGTFEDQGANGIKGTGTIGDTAASGTVSIADGSEHAFTAPLATSPAGLYERLPAKGTSGKVLTAATIVLADGTQRGGSGLTNFQKCVNIGKSFMAYLTAAQTDSNIIDAANDYAGYLIQRNNFNSHGCNGLGAL